MNVNSLESKPMSLQVEHTMAETRYIIHVLLVEDNPDDADLIQESLTDATRRSSRSGRFDRLAAAQRELETREFDIMFLDLGLPDSSGLDTVATVISWNVGIPVVVLTGLAEETVGTQAVELGAQAYLVKRMESFDLLPLNILSALERHQTERPEPPEDAGGLMGSFRKMLGMN